jgi:hypothetical protein
VQPETELAYNAETPELRGALQVFDLGSIAIQFIIAKPLTGTIAT